MILRLLLYGDDTPELPNPNPPQDKDNNGDDNEEPHECGDESESEQGGPTPLEDNPGG